MKHNHLAIQAERLKKKNAPHLALPALVFMTDHSRINDPCPIIPTLPKHTLIIIRDDAHPDRLTYATAIAEACRQHDHPFLVSNDTRLAIDLMADGIHLAESQAGESISIRTHYPQWWITSSAHSLDAVHKANALPVDALFISPVFTTESHPDVTPLGMNGFSELAMHSISPVYALGGITHSNCSALMHSVASGFGCIGAFKLSPGTP